jgi:hypothetical protein
MCLQSVWRPFCCLLYLLLSSLLLLASLLLLTSILLLFPLVFLVLLLFRFPAVPILSCAAVDLAALDDLTAVSVPGILLRIKALLLLVSLLLLKSVSC